MASYTDLAHFRKAVGELSLETRTDFLQAIKFCTIRNTAPLPDDTSTRALVASQALGLVRSEYTCPACSSCFSLVYTSGHPVWRGPRYDAACDECNNKEISPVSIGIFKNLRPKLWISKLDALIMWIKEYQRETIILELAIDHNTVDRWLQEFQETISNWTDYQLKQGLFSPFFSSIAKASSSNVPARKRPSTHTIKRPSSGIIKKKPAFNVNKKPASGKTLQQQVKAQKRIFVADESYINKRKNSGLSRTGRPQRDQVWIWGAVLHGHVNTHLVFRILQHPDHAHDGKPRGTQEMLDNLRILKLQKGDVFVSDEWKGTMSAVKALRKEKGLTEKTLIHESVNHSKGEIKNARGFTTNAIEAKWSLMKRWIRLKLGGRLPAHSDRERWRRLVNEYQGRCILKDRSAMMRNSHGSGRKKFVSTRAFLQLFRIQ